MSVSELLSILRTMIVALLFVATIVAVDSLNIGATWARKLSTVVASITAAAIPFSTMQLDAWSVIDPPAIARFEAAREELRNLDDKWESIVQHEGDNVRRKLGTVYTPPLCTNPLCGFPNFVQKFVKAHPDDLDLPAFEEPMTEFLQAINQADFLAYSSVFSDYGNGGNGEDYIGNSRTQVKRALSAIDEVLKIVKD